jgi:OTU domain-containing protein 6
MEQSESLEQMQARHRKEQRDLQGRITNKKKNATKKTRKGVNDECAELERELRERHEAELRQLLGGDDAGIEDEDGSEKQEEEQQIQAQQQPQPQTSPPSDNSQQVVNGLASTLQTTTLSSPPSAQQQQQRQQQPQQSQQQPPPKKRNRQKERLARRAAELEALAASASSEAAQMPDRRAAERASLEKMFAAHSLREREIAPDGHCLFSAVADQLEAEGVPINKPLATIDKAGGRDGVAGYKLVRAAAADFMVRHRELYEGFLDEDFESYVSKIRDTAEWGGQLELSALAGAYGVEIRVVQANGGGGGGVEVVKPGLVGEEGQADGEGEGVKTLWLAYYRHGYGLGEHYNSLRKEKAG